MGELSEYVTAGELKRRRGRPPLGKRLFQVVAEKLPYESLDEAEKKVRSWRAKLDGVYLSHDSMGVARYGGRGRIFDRLRSHKKAHPTVLFYFSFYLIDDKHHERKIETAILRAAGSQLILNQRKVREGIERGNVADYEPGTLFFGRQYIRGKKLKKKRGRPKKVHT